MKKVLSFLLTTMLLVVFSPELSARITTYSGYVLANNYSPNASGRLYYYISYNSATIVDPGWYTTYRDYRPSGAIVIPDSILYEGILYPVVSIDEQAFYTCYGMTSIIIPPTVVSIGQSAFSNCSGLLSITIPDNVTSIGSYVFGHCTHLKSVTLGRGIGRLRDFTFSSGAVVSCDSLTEVHMLRFYPPTLTSSALSYMPEGVTFYIPCGSLQLYESLWGDNRIYVEDSVYQLTIDVVSSSEQMGSAQIITHPSCEYPNAVISANANEGYHFLRWSNGRTANPDTIYLTHNTVLTATFEPNRYNIVTGVDTSIHGSVSGGGLYDYQSSCTITANANYGYHFTHWNDGVTANPRTITVTRDTSFTAYYAPNLYTLTIVNGEPSFGTVGIEGSNTLTKTVNYGDTISHFGIANTHYHNRYIHIETSGYNSWNKYDHNGRDTSSWYSVMNADYTITYHFAIDTHTVIVAANDNLRGMVESTGTRFTYGSPCILTATAFAGYTFHGWSNGVTDNPYAFAVQEDVNLTAIFLAPGEEMYSIMVTSANPSMGTVSGGGNYNAGETARLTATPNTGYRFVRWQDNNTQNPRNVVVTRDSSFTAYFEALDGIEDVDGNGVSVYAEDGRIVIEGVEGLDVQLYDMMGCILGTNNNSPTATFAVPTSGVYIVKVAGLPARKIVVVR